MSTDLRLGTAGQYLVKSKAPLSQLVNVEVKSGNGKAVLISN